MTRNLRQVASNTVNATFVFSSLISLWLSSTINSYYFCKVYEKQYFVYLCGWHQASKTFSLALSWQQSVKPAGKWNCFCDKQYSNWKLSFFSPQENLKLSFQHFSYYQEEMNIYKTRKRAKSGCHFSQWIIYNEEW